MKTKLFLLSLLAVTLFSCQQEEKPAIFLGGSFDSSLPNEVAFTVNTMTFQKNGSLMVERFMSNGDTEELCLLNYQLGS
jgi:hypothetical protein